MATEPENDHHESEKKHPYRFYWLTGGLATIIAAIIAAAVVHPSSRPANPSSGSSTSSPALSNAGQSSSSPAKGSGSSQGTPSAQLEQALLPTDTLGSGGSISGKGTDLSKIGLICGGPLPGATAAAYETIVDNQTGQFLNETLTAWDNAADARNASMMNHQAIDQKGSCTLSNSGETATYTGDYAGSPPSSCTSGQYLATGATLSSPSLVSSYSGYLVGTLCGTVSVVVSVETDLLFPTITQGIADGYLNTAVDSLESASP
jgi:hypothetical protein